MCDRAGAPGSDWRCRGEHLHFAESRSASPQDLQNAGLFKLAGLPSDVAEKMKALERENRELRQANEILRKASAYFAQAELDRPLKR